MFCQDISESASVLQYLLDIYGLKIYGDDYNKSIAEHIIAGEEYQDWLHVCIADRFVYFYNKCFSERDALRTFGKENVYPYEAFSNEVGITFIGEIAPVDDSQIAAFLIV